MIWKITKNNSIIIKFESKYNWNTLLPFEIPTTTNLHTKFAYLRHTEKWWTTIKCERIGLNMSVRYGRWEKVEEGDLWPPVAPCCSNPSTRGHLTPSPPPKWPTCETSPTATSLFRYISGYLNEHVCVYVLRGQGSPRRERRYNWGESSLKPPGGQKLLRGNAEIRQPRCIFAHYYLIHFFIN